MGTLGIFRRFFLSPLEAQIKYIQPTFFFSLLLPPFFTKKLYIIVRSLRNYVEKQRRKLEEINILNIFVHFQQYLHWHAKKHSKKQRKQIYTYYGPFSFTFRSYLDSYSKWIRQKCYQFFIHKKLKKLFYFLTCILPNYVTHEITKEFWKNSLFENMLTGFLLRCQNSLRWEICMIFHWNIDSWKQKLSFWYVMVPKSNQKII